MKLSSREIESDLPGYFGQPTSTIDWCEANYEVSAYVAEFWNTISNISMIAPPLLGAVLAYIDGMEVRFIGCHLALMVVGIGSSFFHATLLYEMQLMDELPMIWGSAFLIYSLASMDNAPGKINAPLGIGLFLYSLIVTLVYIMVKDPIFHEAAYGLMVVTMIALSVRIMRNHDSSWWCFMAALSLYTIGFIIWNLDNHFCHHFRSARESMGYPLKPLMQGHAWWHLFAGAGTYLSIVFSTHARLKFLKKEPVWKNVFGVWPSVRVMSDKTS